MTPRVKGLLFVFRRSGAARPSWRSHAARLSAACLLLGGASCAVTVSSGAPGDVDAGAPNPDGGPDAAAPQSTTDARDDRRRVDIGDGPSTDGYTCRLNEPFIPGTCDQCLEANCCAEMNACFGSADCLALTDCAFGCVGSAGDAGADAGDCTAQCEAKWPNEVASFRGWVACLGYSCMSQCR
jgi:hypothetical protein